MTIKRTVNGVEMEFELTDCELFNAYMAQQHKFDLEDISNYFFGVEDVDLLEDYGFIRAELETMYEDMANRMRRYMDKYDCTWDYSRDTVIREVLDERKTA